MATTALNSPNKPDNRLCTLDGDKVVWNRSGIMHRAWNQYRHQQTVTKLPRPFGALRLPPMTFAECLEDAWNHAHGFARDLFYLRRVQAMAPERRAVLTLEASNKLGVSGLSALDNAHRACVAAAA